MGLDKRLRRAGAASAIIVGAIASLFTAALWIAPAAAQQDCGGLLSARCLERIGAGAMPARDPACVQELDRYRACVARAAEAAAPRGAQEAREAQAERAYLAVKASGDPAKLALVARRFSGTFWGDLAAQEVEALRAGRAPAPAPIAAEPIDEAALLRAHQTELQRLGDYRGAIDGLWGSGSRRALIAFQRREGLAADGAPSPAILKRLRAAQAVARAAPKAPPSPGPVGPIMARGGLAIDGYDPVAYHDQRRAIRGAAAHVASWGGVDWRFTSRGNRNKFRANPSAYAPRFGGHCAYCLSTGTMRDGDPRYWTVSGGALYLHSSAKNAQAWASNLARYRAKAEQEWRARFGGGAAAASSARSSAPTSLPAAKGPIAVQNGLAIGGYDPVAYFEQARARKGGGAHVATWGGAAWSFATAANRAAFLADPQRYAPRYGGHCANCLANNNLTAGDGRYWSIVDGRLYLHSIERYVSEWRGRYRSLRAQADRNWRRYGGE